MQLIMLQKWQSSGFVKMLIRALLVLLAGSTAAHATPKFEPVEIAPHVYSGGWEHFVGGGLAGFDCNGDNLPELFAAGGAAPAALFINTSQPGKALKFRADTPPELALTGVTGAYPIDFNNDGAVDLAVLRAGKNLLLQGSGDCRFERMADHPQFGDAWTTAFSATWEGSNALPTLAFGNYVDRENPKGPFETCGSVAVKPRSRLIPSRTFSPSRRTATLPRSNSSRSRAVAIVDLPAAVRPVSRTVHGF